MCPACPGTEGCSGGGGSSAALQAASAQALLPSVIFRVTLIQMSAFPGNCRELRGWHEDPCFHKVPCFPSHRDES